MSLFDHNRKKDPVERFLEYMIYHEVMEKGREEEEAKEWTPPSWREMHFYEDIGVYTYQYDTVDDYFEAAERLIWRRHCKKGKQYGVDPLDYETEEEYNEALNEARYAWRDTCEDGSEYDLDPEDFETEEEYEDALDAARQEWREQYWLEDTCGLDPDLYDSREEFEHDLAEAKYGWRKTCEDGSAYGLDPRDYEDRYAYESKLRTAKYGWRDTCDDGTRYGLDPENYETEQAYEEALDQVRRAPYPNERTFQAACELGEAEDGSITIHLDREQAKQIKKRSEFILRGNVTAAKYLTPYGDFLYAQAIKEHFDLPIQLEDEDDETRHGIADVIERIAGKDPQLAFEAWAWCVREFTPYAVYESSPGYVFTALEELDRLPEPFAERLPDLLAEDPRTRSRLMAQSCSYDTVAEVTYCCLRGGYEQLAGIIATAYCDTATVSRTVDFAQNLLAWCKWEEKGDAIALLERYRDSILPILQKTDRKGVLAHIPKWEKEIAERVDHLERYDDRYAYSRRNAWRTTCRDGSAFELDPLDFDSREEYDSRLDELIRRKEEEERREKDRWRWYNCEGPRYGVFPENYETQEAYEEVLKERKAEVEAERAARLRSRIEAAARKKVEEMKEREEEVHRGESDPLAATDKTEYTFCGVTFLHGRQIYYYRTDDESIDVGDRVIVPIGNEGRTIEAEVAAVEKHTRATAPYPVDRAKFVLRKVDPEGEE